MPSVWLLTQRSLPAVTLTPWKFVLPWSTTRPLIEPFTGVGDAACVGEAVGEGLTVAVGGSGEGVAVAEDGGVDVVAGERVGVMRGGEADGAGESKAYVGLSDTLPARSAIL